MKLKTLSAALIAFPCIGMASDDGTLLGTVVITGQSDAQAFRGTSVDNSSLKTQRAATSDTATLLANSPGVSFYGAGGVSSLPSIHGLADDRLRIKVDGMDLIASCPNHMNPALSYIDPTNVGRLKVYAGITPVSVGGDSIGGTIIADTPAPIFATPGQGSLFTGEAGAFYRSNGNTKGGNLSATYATESFSMTYAGATAESDNYDAGGDFKNFTATGRPGHTLALNEVGSTAYKTENQTLGFAFKGENHLIEAKLGYQDVPYQLYPNQRMDMLSNTQHRFNLRYLGQYAWGTLEARAYYEKVEHFMDFGPDKLYDYGMMGSPSLGMPMNTKGETTGASIKADITLTQLDLLRVGGEIQRYHLNDWWPPVAGSMMMGPNTFENINDGQRDRTALFGEWERRLSPQWLTLLGMRYERVNTNADAVHGYNQATPPPPVPMMDMMNQGRDAINFNNADRNQTDNNWDLTALTRYTANTNYDIEFGIARKVRSPNLYERYTWSTAAMMAIMNNTVGDGNGYFGNPDLKSEKAYSVSATFDWHATDRAWELKVTPYYTRVNDYIDAVQWNDATNTQRTTLLVNQFVVLRYINQEARLYGLDLSGHVPLTKTAWGEWGLQGLVSYTNGENRDTGDDLYNIMPLNAKLILTQQAGGWDNSVELVMVKSQDRVSEVRNEFVTSGYSLINLRGSYSWKQTRIDFGIENLFDKSYASPLGGAYTGQGATMGINSIPWGIAVPGMGRSLYAGVSYKF
ncbi:MAG: TonB-dependent receptor [Rhodocyclaceae bacterium]|nr:TonB-dependent receptor [Rhodocyclaceae bacterium]